MCVSEIPISNLDCHLNYLFPHSTRRQTANGIKDKILRDTGRDVESIQNRFRAFYINFRSK